MAKVLSVLHLWTATDQEHKNMLKKENADEPQDDTPDLACCCPYQNWLNPSSSHMRQLDTNLMYPTTSCWTLPMSAPLSTHTAWSTKVKSWLKTIAADTICRRLGGLNLSCSICLHKVEVINTLRQKTLRSTWQGSSDRDWMAYPDWMALWGLMWLAELE